MKLKILYLNSRGTEKFSGGKQCSQRNYDSLCDIFGEKNILKYIISPENSLSEGNYLKRIKTALGGYMGGLNPEIESKIIEIIKSEDFSIVFIDGVLIGRLAKKIKEIKPQAKVYSFFHNVEIVYILNQIISTGNIIKCYWLLNTYINERNAVKYSDKIILLNSRDADKLKSIYHRYPDEIIPITLNDRYYTPTEKIKSTNRKALFLGSYFYGNVHGLKWFCNTILPKVDIDLTIVGSGMDKFKDEAIDLGRVSVYSDVEDLAPYLETADFVILPILSGSGMKVKTAETLMYGKYIIGTEEAFVGYDISNEHGIICKDASQFIMALNNIKLNYKFNVASRNLFLDKYSYEKSLNKFREIFNR